MSQSVLILKGEEWSRRNSGSPWNMNSKSSTTLGTTEIHSTTIIPEVNETATSTDEERTILFPDQNDSMHAEEGICLEARRKQMTDFTPVTTLEDEEKEQHITDFTAVTTVEDEEKEQQQQHNVEKEQQHTSCYMMEAASFPSDSEDTDRASPTSLTSSCMGSDSPWIISHPSEFESTRTNDHEDGPDQRRTLRDLELALQGADQERVRLEQVANAAQSQRTMTLEDLKKKRVELEQSLNHSLNQNVQLRVELEQALNQYVQLQKELEEARTLRDLELALQEAYQERVCLEQVANAAQKTPENLKKKRVELEQALNQNVQLQKELEEARTLRDLELALQEGYQERVRLEQVANAAQSQRIKTLENLKKKRVELEQVLNQNVQLQKELEEANNTQTALEEENNSLKLGLQKVAATKEMIKAKLKTKDEMFKDSQKEIVGLRHQLSQMEHVHTVERELLEHYRKLARHTGFYRWGKPIRQLESQLADPSNLNSSSLF